MTTRGPISVASSSGPSSGGGCGPKHDILLVIISMCPRRKSEPWTDAPELNIVLERVGRDSGEIAADKFGTDACLKPADVSDGVLVSCQTNRRQILLVSKYYLALKPVRYGFRRINPVLR